MSFKLVHENNFSEARLGSLKRMSIGRDRTKNIITDGNNVSDLGVEPKIFKLPFEKGRAINNPKI